MQLVPEVTGKPARSKVVYKPMPEDDPTQRQPDITLAKAKLGWEPMVKLEEGLGRTIEYFRSLGARPADPR